MYLDSYISKSPTGWLLYAGFFWASNCGLSQVAVDVSHLPQANEQVWAYSFISNDRKAIYMEANPWYFLRNRLTPGTVLVLPICNWPKKTTWLSPVSILWRKRIWFQCNGLWSHIERYEESGKENAIYPTKYFS